MRANSMSEVQKNRQASYHQFRRASESHEHAIAIYEPSEGVLGASASINLWRPLVERGGKEYSAAQIRIMSGTKEDFDAIEVGWHVFPWFYGDNDDDDDANGDGNTRFFISWTNNSYRRSCYNDECEGFVMESDKIALGSVLRPISSYDGGQYDLNVGLWKDSESKRWWLSYNYTNVGYWPEELFTHLRTSGRKVEWGGEIFNRKIHNRHTSTEMGSGQFAKEEYGRAAYFKELKVLVGGTDPGWILPRSVTGLTSNPNCYSIKPHTDIDGFGNGGFFYGGPGSGSPSCV
ncbi:uncharacterized protein LOC120000041 [Tripterygium wilfordii]|uniref:uncharacterized protein LOC120000041 n=1 Tax=Tripterygium wilfordii TaxID=458696 RepID=UPI0018F851BA|nr:uncharacterized protein LOC120000041 [Tripterygium wilfordii]